MPRYDYRCPACGVFVMDGRRDEREVECPCGETASRLPFSGVPYLRGETVSRNIPDPVYRQEAQKREFHQTWGDASRSVELLRKAQYTDDQGMRRFDTKVLNDG